jgi:hypothetical protein
MNDMDEYRWIQMNKWKWKIYVLKMATCWPFGLIATSFKGDIPPSLAVNDSIAHDSAVSSYKLIRSQ